jgi:ribosomal protein S21
LNVVILCRSSVRDNNVDQALRALKRKMQREGVFREMKRRRFYEKPTTDGLRAFAADLSGSNLPRQFGPWYVTGVVAENKEPPHGLPRREIEKAMIRTAFSSGG